MKLKKYILLIAFLYINILTAQVGISTTNPFSTLDIRSSSQASPLFNDGILIPKMDKFPTMPAISINQQGMLVYLTTLYSGNLPGFYYWDSFTTSWIGLNSTANSDADWYKVGTTTAPSLITDDMFHSGNVAIGKNTAVYPLEVKTSSYDLAINNNFSSATTNTIDKIGILTTISGSTNDPSTGTSNVLSGSGNGLHFGTNNSLNGTGTGKQIGTNSTLSGAGNGKQYGSFTTINNTGTGIHYGTYNDLSAAGNGDNFGIFNTISTSGTGLQYGIYSSLSNNTGNSNQYGSYVDMTGNGTGSQFGSSVAINNTGSGTHYGNFTDIKGSGTGDQYGISNAISNTGSGIHYGTYNTLSGIATGQQYGLYNSITNSGNATHYGSYSLLNGTGIGIKYGLYNLISATAGGTHYGIYSEVLKAGTNYAGYFLGNLSIGTTSLNNYIMPPSRGTLGQIMVTDAIGNVTWQSPTPVLNSLAWLTTGNTGTVSSTNFLGTLDNIDLVFRRNNIRAGLIGNPDIAVGNKNTSFGANSLNASSTGIRNVAIGTNVLSSNTSGQLNVAIGEQTLFSNTIGIENTALGVGTLYANIDGNYNSGIARNALTSNTSGSSNTATGYASMRSNTIGNLNSAVGTDALRSNVIGNQNVAFGAQASRNTNSSSNTSIGFQSLFSNTAGSNNVAIGFQSGYNELGSNKLYIENSNADEFNALIYGDFTTGAKILRTNSQFQIGNPALAGVGYSLPITRGSANQILQTNGIGATNWVNSSTLAITETDPQVSSTATSAIPRWNGTTLIDGTILDDGTNVGIGVSPSVGNKLDVAGKTKTTNFQMTTGAVANYVLQSDASGNATWAAPNNTFSIVKTHLNISQPLNTGWEKVGFNIIDIDTNSEFNTTTNRFTATKAGIYQINAGFHTNDQSNNNLYSIGVRKNGAFYQQTTANHTWLGPVSRTINCLVQLAPGEFIEIYVENYQSSGVNIDGFIGKSFFEVQQIR